MRGSVCGFVRLLENVIAAGFIVELAGGGIERYADLHTGFVTGGGDGFQHDLDGLFVGFAAGRKAAFIADGSGVTVLLESGLQRMEDFHSPAQRFRKAWGADGHNHEFLKVHRTVGMRAAVEDVHHGAREKICGLLRGIAGKISVERLLEGNGGGARSGHGDGENGVGTETGLGGRAVERDHFVIEGALVGGVEASDGFGDFGVGVGNRLEHALSQIFRFVAIAKFESFVFAGGSAGRNGGAAQCSASEQHVGFDGGITARIDDLASMYPGDLSGHGGLFSRMGAKR